MKALKKLSVLFLSIFLAVTVTSCLDGDDDYQGQATGADVATITSYNGTDVTFTIPINTNTTVTLYSNQAAKIDATKYPVGTRAYITYNYQVGQDMTRPVKIELMSIAPVTTIQLEDVNSAPALSYGPIGLSQLSYVGGYLNMIVTANEASTRTWHCYYDTNMGIANVAHIYLDTQASEEKPSVTNTVLSINLNSLVSMGNIHSVKFHVLSQNGINEYDIQLPQSGGN